MLYGVDAVHGHGAVKGATIFPHNIGMGCTRDPGARRGGGARDRARGRGHRHRLELRALHRRRARRALGPHLRELRRDARAGREPGRGRHPRLRARRPTARAILATAKHFLADGGTAGGKDQGDARISEEELRRIHLPGYVAAIKAGVGSVMVSYSSWNGQPMHGNKHLITDVLKGELGVRRLRRHRLAGDRSDGARRLQPGDRHRDQRRHRHGDGAERVPRLHRAPEGAGRRRPRAAGAHRRRRPPHPEAEGALQAVGEAVHRPRADRARSARPRTARWRATPSARAWSC